MRSAKQVKRAFPMAMMILLAGAVFLCGCTGYSGGESGSPPEITVLTTSPTKVPTIEPAAGEEWIVWREGSNTLNPLGDYFAYGPNVDGKKFNALKVEVRSQEPVTVLFLNDRELAKFEAKMATNAGEFMPIARYDDVNYQLIEVESDEDLNVVVWNQGARLTVADFNIWYKV
ncbi:hypothetical protein AZH53_06815 [Methanomicrobiaceae archaeon CYW5]|uniref:hypothetical protein n=1 Tax=Methanovulcanius yangii TaxID=1789227 RepID=UPI0029CA1EB6|nr:hypothetical protein [Methanovulcanius yangii]MBT8508116.1 hypothetical protein [Methanovulcanius yangii]